MFYLVFFFIFCPSVYAQTKLKLQGSIPLNIDCKLTSLVENGFIGNQYFYNYLSQNGALLNLDKITFHLWIQVHSDSQQKDRQIIFCFFDGNLGSPNLNLFLYYKPEADGTYLYLENQKPGQIIIKLKIALINKQWNFLFISVDQSSENSFISLKLFQTGDTSSNPQFFQHVETLINQKLVYIFNSRSRITNEKLIGQNQKDQKACINIAKFYYINGWTSMDREFYVDYDSQLKFELKPFLSKGIIVTDTSSEINLIKNTNPIEINGSNETNWSGRIFYKNTQIVYNFLEQLPSLTIMFWVKPQNINSSFQFLSFTDDVLQETSIGFGVNKNYKLLFYQIFTNTPYCNLVQDIWNHVTIGFLDISINDDFQQLNQRKLMRIFIDDIERNLTIVTNIKPYKRLVLGPVFMDDQGLELIDLQDVKIFKGFGIRQTFNHDCLIFVGDYCAFCKSNTHYCKEQDPDVDKNEYICPAGYREENNNCIKIIIPNCLRLSSSSSPCEICEQDYELVNGRCQLKSLILSSPFKCNDQNSQLCSFNLTLDIILNTTVEKQISKLCTNNLYSSSQLTCTEQQVQGCLQSQFNNKCFKCTTNFFLTEFKMCQSFCNQKLKFASNGICVNKCDKYLFKFQFPTSFQQWQCNPSKNCNDKDKDIGYYCLTAEQNSNNKTCHSNCKYCYGSLSTNCLACANSSSFYNPYMTACIPDCSVTKNNQFFYSNIYNMTCEFECPPWLYTEGYKCVKECSVGFKLFQNQCFKKNQIDTYEIVKEIPDEVSPKQIVLLQYCPQFCKSCTSDSFCTSCLNQYPMDSNMCVKSCYPQYLEIIDNVGFCRISCGSHDLIYENDNINGYQIKQCFKIKCGSIRANKDYQTFLHQTNINQCMYPCEDGYYGNTLLLQCLPCSPTCATCESSATFCTTCPFFKFLDSNNCYSSCQGKYENYLNWKCEGSCSSGYEVLEQSQSIYACVKWCGQKYSAYEYTLNNKCYKNQPIDGVYCSDKFCYNCNYKCKTCSGPNFNECKSCKPNSYLRKNECVKECYPQFYDKINWQCVDVCPSNTISTTGSETVNGSSQIVTYCSVTCLFNQYQFKEKCYYNKPEETYCLERTNYQFCDSCASVCKECLNAYSSSCLKCSPGAFILGNTCYTDCPNHAPFKDLITNQCVTSCTYFAENGFCVDSCSSSYYQYPALRICFQMGCPLGTYNLPYTKLCYSCYTGCATCTNGYQSGCLACSQGYFMNGGTTCLNTCVVEPDLVQDWVNRKCVQQCPQGTYIRTLDSGSLACTEDCPKYYYSNICVSACPSQTYLDKQICRSCAGPCSECFGVKVNECTKCDLGYYRDETTCYSICPDLKPYANLADQTCVPACPDYLYLKQKYCFNPCPMFLNYYELNGKKECVDQCYSKSYLWIDKCYECNSICRECFGPNNGNCLSCEFPYFLNEQTCGDTCPQFYDLTDYVCKDACPVHLVIQGVTCQDQCDPGYLVYNQLCVLECPTFAYQEDDYCYECNLFCSSCFGPTADECYSCIDNYFLNEQSCKSVCPFFYNKENNECVEDCINIFEITEKKECVSSCPQNYIICESKCLLVLQDGYYLDGNQCQQCDYKCSKCTSATVCQACVRNFYLDINKCVSFCSNEYLFMDPISRSCVTKCPSTLYHLESFGKRFCVADCNYQIYDQCVSECPKGMYSNDKVCTKCPSYCDECESATKCSKCLFGYYLQNEQCQISCTIGKTDRKNIKCVDECDPSLFEYQNECLENCPTDPILYKNKQICSNSCPQNTYQNQQECIDCDLSCSTCIGPSDKDCITCSVGYYLDNQICTQTCPKLYDEVNKQCVLTCPSKLYLDNDKCVNICSTYQYNNNCVNTCPPLTYGLNSNCFDCSENCQECNFFGCIKCSLGTYLNDGLCSNYCPYYYNNVNNECVQLCPKDTFLYIDHCYSQCPLSTFQYKNDCLLACPSLTVLLNNECVQCPERCLICKSEYECSKCESPYFQFNGSCVIHCPLQLPYEDFANGQCVSACPPDAYEREFECIKECNLIIYQKQCLKKCPTGYYGNDYCKPCRLECKACSSFEVCTECNDNFFLEFNQCDTQCTKIKDLKSKLCVDTCNLFLYKNICYETCPQQTYENFNECVLNCNDGYYGSQDYKCKKCPKQCGRCINALECTKCHIGYFLHNKQCLDQCPGSFFSNPILNECSTKCPLTTFIFQNSCLFECPSEYLNDMENYKCVSNCGSQQYLSKKNCLKCALECDQCTARGNNNCINCASSFKLTEDGLCIGNCKDGYYKSDNSCQQCLHKCQTCENGTDCIKCRGTNRNPQDCSCQKGYYDDIFYDDCKKCPCDECTASDNCLICKNNLQVPKCSCDRILNDDWCITCQVAKVNIQYTDDLNQIIVYFGYLISVNLINPFQPSDCSLWFDNSEILGLNAQCYLSWNRYAVHIILKPYASVNIGDKLDFKNSFYKDVDQGICDGQFIEQFIENKVKEPQSLYKPYILFDIPSFVSTCKTIFIKQILLNGTGLKIQNILSWTLKEMENEEQYLQMDAFLADQQNEITIPIGTLQPNVTYTITAKYVNFLQRVNFTTFTFTTLPIQAPYVFLSYEPLIARVYVFDCHVSYSDLKTEFNVSIEIRGSENESYLKLSQQINPIYEIPLNESLLPKEIPLLFTASTGSSIIKETIYLKSKTIDIKFLQKNRFIGLDDQINSRGYDRNIEDEVLSTQGIIYEWQCNNLNNLQPCKTDENQIMQFPSRRIVNIFADSQNTTLVFFAKASKGDRWTVKEQLIVITDFNIEEEFHINNQDPTNFINANDEVTILIKKQQQYAFIIQQHKILESIKISSLSLKFRLAGLTTNYKSPVYIYLVPGNESIAFKLNDPPQQVFLQIEPLIGESLEYFNYTLSNLQAGSSISFYYYFENSSLEIDVNEQSINNGIPLITSSKETFGSFQLPNGITNTSIQVLCEISSNYGAKSYLRQEIYVVRKNYEIQQLYQSFTNKTNLEDLQSLHTMIALIQLEEQQVCLKQCSGVGSCLNNKCQCPPGYYFADCSGNQEQQIQFNEFMIDVIKSLIKTPIKNNNDMKLFSQSLYFLTQFNDNNTLSLEDCSIILQSYIQNTNSRLEQINQYSINLQYQSTDDFNYSQIDIRSLVNKNDLHTALKSTVFMWEKTLFTSGSNVYQLQYYLNNFINNIIELTIFALNPNEKIDFSIDTASIKIQKSKTIPQTSNRILEEINSENSTIYDIVQAIYIRNFYAFDGYFPYPQQIYPLYTYQIRQSNRKENIQLNQPISYKFGIQNDTTNLVCLQRNSKTYEWFHQNCTISEINSTYYCNCTTLSPTTICNDYDFLYQGSSRFQINLPNIFYIIYIIQLIILGIFMSKSKIQENEQQTVNTKFGHVFKLTKNSNVNIIGNLVYPAKQEKDTRELITRPQISSQDKQNDKFHFNHFWKYHCLAQLIFKQQIYLSPLMRSLLILLRWNSAVIFGEILSLFQFEYQVSIWIILASIIVMRLSENILKQQTKYFFIMKKIIVVIIIKGLILLFLVFTILSGLYFYFMIDNQTNLIFSYCSAILIDIFLLDIIIFSSKRFLGENKKKNIRKKIKELKQFAKIQRQNE